MKLGKLPATTDHRDFKLATFVDLAAVLPTIPKAFGHEKGIAFPICANGPDPTAPAGSTDGVGDCVFAGGDHETALWRHVAGLEDAGFNGKTAVHDYSAVTGYVPGRGDTDKGTSVRDALNYRRKTGLIDTAGRRHKITAYLALDPGNTQHLLVALYLFEAVGIGIQFPASAMSQFNEKKPWSVVKGSPIEGGHYVPLVARRQYLKCVTWGRVQAMTQGFYTANCDEAYAILSPESISRATKKTAEGFDLASLQKNLAALAA